MEKRLIKSSTRHQFVGIGNSELIASILASILLLTLFIGSIGSRNCPYTATTRQTPSETRYTYLVKLRYLPFFDNDGCYQTNSVWHWQRNFDNLIAKSGADVKDLYPDINYGRLGRWIIVTAKNNIFSVLQNNSDIESVEDGALIYRNVDGDYYYSSGDNVKDDKTWGIRIPRVQEALAILKPVRNIVIAVVDTGCDLKHPALKDSLVQGRNFAGGDVNDTSNRNSNEIHATHVTGTLIAKRDDDGFFGIANGIAKVMPIRVLNESGSGTLVNVCRGIEWAASHNVNVINMSLGSTYYSRALHDAIKYAVNTKSVTVACARGNSNNSERFYPACFPEVIGVTASTLKKDGTEERAEFSSYGENSTCSAPGHYTYSTLPGGRYGFASGTSMACPHATACVAVIRSQEGNFTPELVKYILETHGDNITTDKPIGKRINLLKFISP